MAVVLSKRLQRLADSVELGARVVDVGCDHALLVMYLVQTSQVTYAVGTDVVQGPYQTALEHVRAEGLTDQVSVRLGDGLATLEPGEVNTAVIAGMGGYTMTEILRRTPAVVDKLQRLILQPMNAAHQVRRWLYDHGFQLLDESVCADDGRLYEIIVAERIHTQEPDVAYIPFLHDINNEGLAFAFGPLALTKMEPEFVELMGRTIEQWENICRQLASSTSAEAHTRMMELRARITLSSRWITAAENG